MDRLKEIKGRCVGVTPGPWKWDSGNTEIEVESTRQPIAIVDTRHEWGESPGIQPRLCDWNSDGEFIAHAREDIPWLISQVEKAIEIAEFYGSMARWSYKALDNETWQGQKAREFLEQMK